MPASNSKDNRDPDQDTDSPLPNHGNANVAQPGDTAEDYNHWLGDDETLGPIPKLMIFFLVFVSVLSVGFLLMRLFLGEVLGLKRYIDPQLLEVMLLLALDYVAIILITL